MTHDEILKAARERIAEIDKQTADLAAERVKLQAMIGAPTQVVPWARPQPHIDPLPLPCPPPIYPEPYRPLTLPWDGTWTPYAADGTTAAPPWGTGCIMTAVSSADLMQGIVWDAGPAGVLVHDDGFAYGPSPSISRSDVRYS